MALKWPKMSMALIWAKIFMALPWPKIFMALKCTEVHFTSFLSGELTTMAVINPPERKLAKHASVQRIKFQIDGYRVLKEHQCALLYCKLSSKYFHQFTRATQDQKAKEQFSIDLPLQLWLLSMVQCLPSCRAYVRIELWYKRASLVPQRHHFSSNSIRGKKS